MCEVVQTRSLHLVKNNAEMSSPGSPRQRIPGQRLEREHFTAGCDPERRRDEENGAEKDGKATQG